VISVVFTENIQRHVACPAVCVAGATVGEVLDRVFEANERARGYVLNERGELRKHMVVFINGTPIRDRMTLSDPVVDGSEVCVMQALSGG
jgi:molybdopterin converting factor small subunit